MQQEQYRVIFWPTRRTICVGSYEYCRRFWKDLQQDSNANAYEIVEWDGPGKGGYIKDILGDRMGP